MIGRKHRFVMLALALALAPVGLSGQQAEPVVVRVLTYNIRHGEGMDRRYDLFRLAEIMKGIDADLIALQEVDQGTARAGGEMQLDELAGLLGMHGVFGRAIDFQDGEYGVAVLSRWPLLGSDNRPLPSSSWNESRTVLSAQVKVGESGPIIRFSTTHLENDREGWDDRVAQVGALNRLLTQDEQPSIIGGDFNVREETDILAILDTAWRNVVTTTPQGGEQGNRRGARSDFILFRPAHAWRVVEWQVIDAPVASDHRPVLAVLEWVGESLDR